MLSQALRQVALLAGDQRYNLPSQSGTGMIGQTISHYRIVEKLGEGGMGVVYKAEDTKLARVVALKFLGAHLLGDHEAKQRFLREAQAAAALNHPNICTVHEIDEAEGRTFIAMAFVEGESLEQKIARGPLPIKETLDIAQQITKGLQAAHEKGIIHRDIKPANILLDPKGHATIMDFGLARLTEASRLTRADTTMGTVAYMSPEQAQGRQVDQRSDIWSLGVVLYEMICGRPPFQGQYDQALLYEICNEEPEPPTSVRSGVPMELEWITAKCLAKDAEDRYAVAGELGTDLRTLAEKLKSGRSKVLKPATGLPTQPAGEAAARPVAGATSDESPAASGMEQASRKRRLMRIAWGFLTVLLAMAAVALAFVHFGETPPERRVYQFQLVLRGVPNPGHPSLSPDGRHVVFTTSPSQTKIDDLRLWVRSLDSLETRALPGTEGARYPFWSPDSAHVGFFADGKLKRIALFGGSPQSLCDAEDGRGGTWSRDGVIVFSPNNLAPLQRVPEAGGVPVTLATGDAPEQTYMRRFPWFLPDGRHFLYSLIGPDPATTGIYMGSLEGLPPVRLLGDVSNAVFVQDPRGERGFLLFVRAGILMAQPFDAGNPELSGEIFPVVEVVATGGSAGYFGFSVSRNGELLYQADYGPPEAQLAWFDRSGKRLESVGEPGRIAAFSLAPDEKRAAVSLFDERGGYRLWSLEFARGTMSSLSSVSASAGGFLLWSPDGGDIVFAALQDGRARMARLHLAGTGKVEWLLPVDALATNWSRDGRFILYHQQGPATSLDIWVLPLEGDRKPFPYLQTESFESGGRLSPDGRWVAYTSNESGRFEIYIRPFPSADRKWLVSAEGGLLDRWRADGKELYYIAPDQKLMAVTLTLGDSVEAGAPQALFQTPLTAATSIFPGYDVSRDGQRFLIPIPVEGSTNTSLVVITNWQAKFRK